jgi:HPt (histidine-containing phosphotransfer) domain-containing protein
MSITSNEVQQKLAALQHDYICNLPDKLGTITQHHSLLKSGSDKAQALDELHKLAHKLAGTAGTFGCPEISTAARNYDEFLKQLKIQPYLNSNDMQALETRYENLQLAVEQTMKHNHCAANGKVAP